MSLEKLTKVVKKEIRELAKDFKAQNGNSSLRIPNKDMNLWIINKLIEQDGRISKVEAKQAAFILLVTLFAASITIFKII